MTASISDTLDHTSLRDRAVDAVRQVAHAAHEARLLKSGAADAIEDGVYTATRAMTHGARDLEELRDSAVYRIKRSPLATVGLALGTGILLGMALARCTRKAPRQTQ